MVFTASGKDHLKGVEATANGEFAMYAELFQELGIAKNEGRIYEALLQHGESTAGEISKHSLIHRRNVYDSLKNLQERGLVFEVRTQRENRYLPVSPKKLMEMLDEKREKLKRVLPQLEELYQANPQERSVMIYRGIEGWKNYMRDILLVGETYYCIGGKGAWMDERLRDFFPWFMQELSKQNIECKVLFDSEVKNSEHGVVQHVGDHYRFLPKEFSSAASIEVFGDRVNLITDIGLGGMKKDFEFTVIVNPDLAHGFRQWFSFMYEACSSDKA